MEIQLKCVFALYFQQSSKALKLIFVLAVVEIRILHILAVKNYKDQTCNQVFVS